MVASVQLHGHSSCLRISGATLRRAMCDAQGAEREGDVVQGKFCWNSKFFQFNKFKVIESTLSKDEFELAQLDKDEQKIIDKRGFVNILNQITESKTPVVFHAGWLDLILTMRQFYLSEMPPTLTEFKAATMEVFPNVFDTLLMVRNDPLKSLFLGGNRLQDIYDR